MVNVSQKYNLNHIYYRRLSPGNLAVGFHVEIDHYTEMLFEKSLALTSDLKRLPILRSIAITEIISRLAGAELQASGVNFATIYILILNETLTAGELQAIFENAEFEDHDVIYSACISIVQSGGVITTHTMNESSWDFEGGLLLDNEITIGIITQTATDVAVAQLPPPAVFDLFMEIDWVPVSKAEFTEFILENVYAKND